MAIIKVPIPNLEIFNSWELTDNNSTMANNTLPPYSRDASLLNLHSNETLIMAFLIAALLHTAVIFGITFTIPTPQKAQTNQTLDIVLVNTKAEKAPEDPDFLAQANQMGGGNLKEKAKPTSKNPGKTPVEGNALENKPQIAPAPEPIIVATKSVLSTPKPSKQKAPQLLKKKKPIPRKAPELVADYMADLQQQIIEVEADLYEQNKLLAKRPKATYITASTRHAPSAAYIKHWTKKIERIGNLNYPDKARRKKLEGQLRLIVTLSPEGNVVSIHISKSSGHKILDDAAKRIVQLAAPYARIPKEVLQGNRRLVITRTWQFSHSNGKFSYK